MKFRALSFFFCLQVFAGLASFEAMARVVASVDYYIVPASRGGGQLFLLLGIDGKSLQLKRLENGMSKGDATFAVSINDSVRNFFGERIDLATPAILEKDIKGQVFHSVKSVPLPAGKFSVEMTIFDPNSSDTTRERIAFQVNMPDASRNPVLSDLLFLEPSAFDPNRPITTQPVNALRVSDFFSSKDSSIHFYCEAQGFLSHFPAGTNLVSRVRIIEKETQHSYSDFGKLRKIKSSDKMAWKMEIPILNLPSGNFLLSWDIRDSTGKVVAQTYRTFSRSNNLREAGAVDPSLLGKMADVLAPLREADGRYVVLSMSPLATASEQTTISYLGKKGTEAEIKKYLAEFWSRRNAQDPVKAYHDFRKLLEVAEKRYATQTMKAFQTERGRVVIQYGLPNIIENEYSDRNRKAMENLNTIPYEIWYYYTIDQPVKQNDIMFVFVQTNRGNDNYRLLHSSAIGEVRNTEWRKAVENNATYNFDRMNPDDRNDVGNPRNAR